jgi:pyrrolidone-carboxylate peptidase
MERRERGHYGYHSRLPCDDTNTRLAREEVSVSSKEEVAGTFITRYVLRKVVGYFALLD